MHAKKGAQEQEGGIKTWVVVEKVPSFIFDSEGYTIYKVVCRAVAQNLIKRI